MSYGLGARHAGGLLAFVLLATTLAFGIPDASAASNTDRQAASSNSSWLASKLTDGAFANPLNPELPDYGLMLDAVFAMYASADGTLAAPIIARLDDKKEGRSYFTYYGFGKGQDWIQNEGLDDRVAGAAAKVLVGAEASGRDPHAFGGYDMVAETLKTIIRAQDVAPGGRFADGTSINAGGFSIGASEVGRITDYGPTTSYNNSNTFGQALAVIGLAGAKANDQSAIDKLIWQQCSAGYYRIFYSYDTTTNALQTCDEGIATGFSSPDRDSTAMGLSALLAARKAGATGLQPSIDKAVAWLETEQQSDGGWGGGVGTEATNTNSTGLIAQALADAGASTDAITRGAGFIRSAQAIATDSSDALKDDIGAIAYVPGDYEQAKTDGIGSLDTWIRASAQASLGLSRQSFWNLVTNSVVSPTPSATPTPSTTPTATATSSAAAPATSAAPKTAVKKAAPAKSTTATPQSTAPAFRLASYFAGQLVAGTHIEVTGSGKTYTDYDATADVVLALRALGEQPLVMQQASHFLLTSAAVNAYVHGAPYEQGQATYGEAAAKVLLIGQLLQSDGLTSSDENDTITALATTLGSLVDSSGKVVDAGSYADTTDSVQRQALVALALSTDPVHSQRQLVLDRLASHQCSDGLFPHVLATASCATGEASATGWALTALNTVPAGTTSALPSDRRDRLVAALMVLQASSADGLVQGVAGVDLAATSAVVMGSQAAGLDGSSVARGVSAGMSDDGGLAVPGSKTADLARSLSGAFAIAGRGWVLLPSSPVVRAALLVGPLASTATSASPTPQTVQPPAPSPMTASSWRDWTLPISIGVAAALAIAAATIIIPRLRNRSR